MTCTKLRITASSPPDPELSGVYDCSDLNGSATITWGTGDLTTATVIKENRRAGPA